MTIINRFKELCIRLLIRFGRIKSAPIEISKIELLVNDWLPETFNFEIPGGNAELKLINLALSNKKNIEELEAQKLRIILFCNFRIVVNGSMVFNTHLNLNVIAEPDYSLNLKTIGVKNTELIDVDLINDKDSFIRDVSTLANGLLPSPLKGMFNIAMASSKVFLGEDVMNGLTRYLSIYNAGNQQKIIDYHRSDIENKIIEISLDPDLRYKLDKTDFEENLFLEFGKSIRLEKNQLQFYFE